MIALLIQVHTAALEQVRLSTLGCAFGKTRYDVIPVLIVTCPSSIATAFIVATTKQHNIGDDMPFSSPNLEIQKRIFGIGSIHPYALRN